MRSLDFIQIIYKDEQKEYCYPFSRVFFNKHLTSFFENSIIEELVPKCDTDLIGICSWRLREKRGSGPSEIILKRQGTFELTRENITEKEYDVAILTPHSSTHKPLTMASNWHGKAWDDAFMSLKAFLHSNKLCKVPDELTNTIYENHFITTREIYHKYVSDCLKPVIEFMRKEEVFNADSGYIQKKKREPQAIADYQRVSGRTDWPIAPFILERLFSIWIDNKNLKVINL